MKKEITINDIQEWEKSFTKRKGISQNEETAIKIAMFKLTEEVGEVAKAVLEENWKEVPAEVSDVIVFACKVANLLLYHDHCLCFLGDIPLTCPPVKRAVEAGPSS